MPARSHVKKLSLPLSAVPLCAALAFYPTPSLSAVTPGTFEMLDCPPVLYIPHPIGANVPVGEVIENSNGGIISGAHGTAPIAQFIPFPQSYGTSINDGGLVAVTLASVPPSISLPPGAESLSYLWQAGPTMPIWTGAGANTQIMVQETPSWGAPSYLGDNLWQYGTVRALLNSGDAVVTINPSWLSAGATLNGSWPLSFLLHDPGTNAGTLSQYGFNHAINRSGTAVGSAESGIGQPSFAWFEPSDQPPLTVMGRAGYGRSSFDFLNERNVAVGWAEYQPDLFQAVSYQHSQLCLLGLLPGASYSFATGINEPGAVIGYSSNDPDTGLGFISKSGTLSPLGSLNAAADSVPNAINNAGTIVGSSGGHAFLWANGNMIDLNSLLPANSGWVLTSANSINNFGQIVGDGVFQGLQRAFYYDLPSSGNPSMVITQNSSTLDINGVTRLCAGLSSSSPNGIITNTNPLPVLLRLTTTSNQSFSGTITGNLTLVKDGPATQSLSGASTYNGGTIVSAGTLALAGSINSASDSIMVEPGATFTLLPGATIPATTTFTNSGTVNLNSGSLTLASVNNDAAGALLTLNATNLKVTTSFLLSGSSGAWTSGLDLTTSKFILQSDSLSKPAALDQARDQVKFGLTSSAGIFSSTLHAHTAIAVLDNAITHFSTFGGLPADANSILIAPELLGDANIDGHVDLSDLSTILNHFGATTPNWTDGNFDNAPTIDLTDLSYVLNNFGLTNPNTSSFTLQPSASPAIPTPEPGSLLPSTAVIPCLLRRRNRHSQARFFRDV